MARVERSEMEFTATDFCGRLGVEILKRLPHEDVRKPLKAKADLGEIRLAWGGPSTARRSLAAEGLTEARVIRGDPVGLTDSRSQSAGFDQF
jgi:hypothetical protein